MKNKHTLLEIQEKSNIIHNYKYDIDLKQKYNKMIDYINIKCKKCNYIFNQQVKNHIHCKAGCPKCSGKKKLTFDDIILKSKKLNGDKYTIEPQKFINSSSKIIINCNICNIKFNQTINSHLCGKGCPKCANNIKLSIFDIREKSIKNMVINILYQNK